jgi:putative ABC transport system permease protein
MGFLDRVRRMRGLNEEIDAELDFHIGERERQLVAGGLPPDEARREARKSFGSQAAVREYTRDAWIFRWADDLWRDLRFAARGLRRSPGFTAVAVLTLALGIGGCAAMYAFVEQLILLDQPYPDRESLTVVEEVDPQDPQSTAGITADALLALQERSDSFAEIAGYNTDGFAFKTSGDVRILDGALVTPNVFDVLDVQPLLGRTLDTNAVNEVVLSELAWKRYFGGRPEVLESPVELNGRAYSVVGVMPKEFWRGRDLWVPLGKTPREAGRLRTWARLKSGVRAEAAQAELDVLTDALALDRVAAGPRRLALRDPFALSGGQRGMLAASAIAPVALVFLIVCVNVIHLQLGRNLQRGREMALCRALGAGRLRLIRRLMAESFVLATLGGVCGVAVAWWAVNLIEIYLPAALSLSIERLQLDASALAFLLLLSAATTVAIGVVPALRASGLNLTAALKEGGRGQTSGNKFRSVLATSELALSMTLLAGTGMMVAMTQRVAEIQMGFDARSLWTARLSLRGPLASGESRRAWADSALREVQAMPGVSSAAIATEVPLRGGNVRRFEAVGESVTAGEAEFRSVSSNYFETLSVPLRLGRAFVDTDRQGAAPVAIVNDTLARRYLGGRALGKQIRVAGGEMREVVGVAADVRQNADARPAPPIAYVPFSQVPDAPLSLVIRAQDAAGTTGRDVLDRLGAPSGELIVLSVFDFEQELLDGLRARGFLPATMAMFAVLGLVLAGVGLYGTTSRAVSQRTQEFGVRQALGARPGDILRLVMRESGRGGLAGMAIGLAGSFAAVRLLLATMVSQERAAYGVDLLDSGDLVYAGAGAAGLLILVVLLAAYVPARRATKAEPAIALRHD